MRFLTRSIVGIFLMALTFGLLVLAAGIVLRALEERAQGGPPGRPAQERVFAVNVDTLTLGTATPVITAYGEIKSWRTLEIRTSAAGQIVELAEAFRDGGRVEEGQLLYRIDPADARAERDVARTQLDEIEAEIDEAAAALALAEEEVAAARQQREHRDPDVAAKRIQRRGRSFE